MDHPVTRSTNKSVWEEIGGGEEELTLGKRTVPSRAYASWFNFKGRDQQRKADPSPGASATGCTREAAPKKARIS